MNSDSRPPFEAAGTDAVPQFPALIGGKCRCGNIFFPMQRFGCEACGRQGDDLSEVKLSGRGTLHTFAQVHLHARPYPKVPFTVLEIALDDGPLVRALFDQPTEADLRRGDRMVATVVRQRRGETDIDVLRFRRANAAE